MLSGLLDRSQLDAGGVRPNVRDVALVDVFEQLERDLAPQAAERGVRLRIVPTRCVARTDPLLLARILRTLVSNALRYAGSGASVLVGVRPRMQKIVIEVRDSGPGIPGRSQRDVFDAFHQLERGREGGLGLGLSIVDGLARVLGHEVALRSAPGHGSTFAVSLPRAAAARSRAGALEPVAASPAAPLARHVLLVEDDARVRRATCALLDDWRCETREASDLSEAQAVLADGWRPDFVLVDYHLANGENGLDLLAALRARFTENLPAAVITSETSTALLARIKSAGFPVLRKPVKPARLRAVLTVAAGGRSSTVNGGEGGT
jgi:CheY-like chemotaxis protein